MLNPDSRTVLRDALRPDPGYEIDLAIGTTYSLDLAAMLLAPIAFGRLDGVQREATPGAGPVSTVDPLALLQAIRGYAERTIVFCQAGKIAVPHAYHRLHAYLEDSIVEVNPTSPQGVFHPKVWALRMKNGDGAVTYRVLVMSRNLTFDSSWDTCLVLEGPLRDDRSRAFKVNHPLADFFAALPGLAVVKPSQRRRKAVELVADELRRTEFEFPDGFDDFEFRPIGLTGYEGMPFQDDRADKRLIISPFVADGALRQLPGKGGTLVSRLDELDQLNPATLSLFDEVFVLADAAEAVDEDGEQPELRPSEVSPPPSGLHAKLFLLDDGWNSQVWTGSANATNAAFSQNVEFLVRLQGKRSVTGVEAMMAEARGTHVFRELLQPYPGKGRQQPELTAEEKLEAELRRVRSLLARLHWTALVKPLADTTFDVTLSASGPLALPEGWSLRARPSSVNDTLIQSFGQLHSVTFPRCSFESLTAFFALTLEAPGLEDAFVVHAPLQGAPEDRLARVLDAMLANREAVLRFLRLLLAMDAVDIIEALEDWQGATEGSSQSKSGVVEPPLLESMLRALAREPEKLDAIERVVADLSKTPSGLDRLPAGFLAAWEPIRQARAVLKGERR